MADDVVTRAEGLGKKYLIGHAAERDCAHPAVTCIVQCYGGSSIQAATFQYQIYRASGHFRQAACLSAQDARA
jgi:hypothetical protein